MEKQVSELRDQDGQGTEELLRKEYDKQIQQPLVGIEESITLPPSARIRGSGSEKDKEMTYVRPKTKKKTSSSVVFSRTT